jgi:hypothetical protein
VPLGIERNFLSQSARLAWLDSRASEKGPN